MISSGEKHKTYNWNKGWNFRLWRCSTLYFVSVFYIFASRNVLYHDAVAGSIALRDYWEAATIVFLFTISEWLESRASHKVIITFSIPIILFLFKLLSWSLSLLCNLALFQPSTYNFDGFDNSSAKVIICCINNLHLKTRTCSLWM